jgi:hypothetical protein
MYPIKPVEILNRSLMRRLKWVIYVVAVIAGFGIVGHFDAEEAEQQESDYCEMVTLYKADKAAGVPEHDRRGWPEFKKGEVSCQM